MSRLRIESGPPQDRAMSIKEIELFCQRVHALSVDSGEVVPLAAVRINGGIKSLVVEVEV